MGFFGVGWGLNGRLRRANKALSRKRRGSANFRKLTPRVTKAYRAIGIEDLNVR
jgi:hypothetical protein